MTKHQKLYDQIVAYLESKGCPFVDCGGYEVTGVRDDHYSPHIVVSCPSDRGVAITPRLWYRQVCEIQSIKYVVFDDFDSAQKAIDLLYITLDIHNEYVNSINNYFNDMIANLEG